MDPSIIGLLALIVALIGSIVGAFAYLMGEMRKIITTMERGDDELREQTQKRIEQVVRRDDEERNRLRVEILSTISRTEGEMRSLADRVVRRNDVEQIEARLTRSYDKLEAKIDLLTVRMSDVLMSTSGKRVDQRGGNPGGND